MSMLRSEAQADRPRPMVLLYSNSRPENAAYLDELRELEQRLDGFRLVLTMTEMKDSDSWRGETRRIDADMVKEATSGLPGPITMSPAHPTWRRTCGRCWTTWASTTMTSTARTYRLYLGSIQEFVLRRPAAAQLARISIRNAGSRVSLPSRWPCRWNSCRL